MTPSIMVAFAIQQLAAPVPTPTPEPSLPWLLGTIFVLVLSVMAAIVIILRWWDAIDSLLTRGTRYRVVFAICFSVVVPLLLATAIDVADFSVVLDIKGIPSRQGWLVCFTVVLAVTYVSGQVILMLHDDAWDKRLKVAEKQKEEAELTAKEHKRLRDFVMRVDESMLQFVGAKKDRARSAADLRQPIGARDLMERVNCPLEQIKMLCDVFRELLKHELDGEFGHGVMRVACFHAEDGYLHPVYSFDGVSRDFVMGVYANYREHFNLAGAERTSLAVAAARQHRILIVEDSLKANDDSNNPFCFLGPAQRDGVQSMMAVPIGRITDSDYADYVVCFDTRTCGFFAEARREMYDLIQRNIEPRLLFETYIMKLASMVGKDRANGGTIDHVN